MANHVHEYVNPLYCADDNSEFLVPNTASQNIKFWREMYCRFESGVHPREPIKEILHASADHSTALKDHINLLQCRIAQLEKLLGAKLKNFFFFFP